MDVINFFYILFHALDCTMYDLGFSPLGLVIVDANVASSSSQRSRISDHVGCLWNHPEYESIITRYFQLLHSKILALTSVHGNSGVGWFFMSSLVLCGFVLLHGLHEAITFVYLLSLLAIRQGPRKLFWSGRGLNFEI